MKKTNMLDYFAGDLMGVLPGSVVYGQLKMHPLGMVHECHWNALENVASQICLTAMDK